MSSQGKFVFVLNEIPGHECLQKNSGVISRVKLGSKWKMRYPIYGPAFLPSPVTFLVYLRCVQFYAYNSHQNFVGISYFLNSAYLLSKSYPSAVHYRDNTT